jgi:hypothetical protein
MNCAAKLLNKALLICVCAAVGCTFALTGCTSTVAPKAAVSSQASFDVGGQNSGILAEADDRSLVVTPLLRDRYNALVARYGPQFEPPLQQDQGIAPTATNTFIMSPEAFEHFAAMNRWRKQAAPPWSAQAK